MSDSRPRKNREMPAGSIALTVALHSNCSTEVQESTARRKKKVEFATTVAPRDAIRRLNDCLQMLKAASLTQPVCESDSL